MKTHWVLLDCKRKKELRQSFTYSSKSLKYRRFWRLVFYSGPASNWQCDVWQDIHLLVFSFFIWKLRWLDRFILFSFPKNAVGLSIVRADNYLVHPGSPVPIFMLASVWSGWFRCPTGCYVVWLFCQLMIVGELHKFQELLGTKYYHCRFQNTCMLWAKSM